MGKGLQSKANKMNESRRRRKWWQGAVRVLATAVVFCTTYALILPAITMEKEAVCGQQPHTHTDECYVLQPVYTWNCGLEAKKTVIHTHSEVCFDADGKVVCTLPEKAEHVHGDGCYEKTKVCDSAHVHSEACAVTEQVLICTEEEGEAHTHGEGCYETREVPCTLTEDPAHVHEDACYVIGEAPVCGKQILVAHTHGETCRDENGELTCLLPETIVHNHTAECRTEGEPQKILTCQLPEHTHTELCYPVEEDQQEVVTEYLCGSGVHTHVDTCYGVDGHMTCTIPEHAHVAQCLVEGLDLNADLESPVIWEAPFAALTLEGSPAENLLAVAQTQLGYRESVKNVILEGDSLKGYTRYGAKYDAPYADWSALFVRFCLDYAGVEIPTAATSDAWAALLAQAGQFIAAPGVTPEAGDLVFLDTDDDGNADQMAIVAGHIEGTEQWKLLTGNHTAGCVEYKVCALTDDSILGYCGLPEDTVSEVKRDPAVVTAEAIAALPDAQAAREKLQQLNKVLDKAGYEAYLKELKSLASAAREGYAALDEERRAMIGDIAPLEALEALCVEAVWKELPALTEHDALVSDLDATELAVETVENGQTVPFGFQVHTHSISGTNYGRGRVKMEFVLPLTAQQAEFDLASMPWLVEPEVTRQTRTIGDSEVRCQVLTGYVTLQTTDADVPVIPGGFAGNAAVKVLAMGHGENVGIQISAAMEHSVWEGTCEAHAAQEKLTVTSRNVMVLAYASPEEQQAQYETLMSQWQALQEQQLPEEAMTEAAQVLWEEISNAYLTGFLAEDTFAELSLKVSQLIYGDLNSVAEPQTGMNWMLLAESGWFEEYSEAAAMYAKTTAAAQITEATQPEPEAVTVDEPSDVQIREEGGEAISDEGAVYVSKTIDGTGTENVFDITLTVITQDIVTEVYEEPDMAVVIVMDISNTMKSNFGSTTRYAAAMTAAENFLTQFASNNLGASRVGFVAFNTDAHEIFPMSACSTTAQANSLKNTMRTKTGNIINPTNYADSKKRFTNIEAGLKRAYDMLNTVDNEHKYIVFLSDGFPTTYIQSGYVGYDTYDTSGSRFYDSVELYNGKKRPCTYGVSYSNEAAIRARKMATTLKNNGTTIFSIGVDIGGQTIKYYVDSFKGKTFTVVDRRNTDYEIGSASSTSAFKNWLGTKIGSGTDYYYDSTNATGLNNAFNRIFEQIKELNASSSHLDWVTTDPMPDMGVHEMEAMEFIGFFDKSGTLVEGSLTGTSADGTQYENTASFDTAESTIHWDLKKSGYISTVMNNVTHYQCTLTYRVRLKNENQNFEEYLAYDTNDVTSLTYRVIDQTGNQVVVSEQRSVDFPIPAVEGYLEELSFTKVGGMDMPLEGAEFTLTHDTADCGFCRGDGKGHVYLAPMKATSGADGIVTFRNVPSGHAYTLEETGVPTDYDVTGNTYKVKVAYDELTVTVTDKDGNPVTWDERIENHLKYRLPETGGEGIAHYRTFGAMLLMAAALVCKSMHDKKRGKGGGR